MVIVKIDRMAGTLGQTIVIEGWLYNVRSSGSITFLELRDGSGFVQAVVVKDSVSNEVWEATQKLTQESSLRVTGLVASHPKKENVFELQVTAIEIIAIAPEYPIALKDHGPEFLFDNRDLYLRAKTPWAVLRIRNQMFLSITNFFHEQGFIRFDTPILQPTSCEDTTQLFQLDYYGEPMYLTQSGQLYSEAGIMAFGKVYDFGPVFRAEKSKTRHHLSELWMMDAEMAFFDQAMNMDTQEKMIKRMVGDVLKNCVEELVILERDTTILQKLVNEPFVHLKHSEAKEILAADGFTIDKLDDMGTEEEIYLGNKYKLPIFIEDYPFAVKAFYMKSYVDEAGVKRAHNADLIAPEEGREIIGGSQREDNYDTLLNEILTRNYPRAEYEWYLNTRKFGSVPHSGFGIGLERTVRWITRAHHIRECIPFARMVNRNRP
ncbi:MAG: asparagine--tRNA ligase [Candidatus Magasanikbacteria bacterium RIFCSPHIGHO2_01_FULL_41_23]|uniref:Asparagine--tRNA ligase n=1 Tax=Candidatus Magasanikbacteria bacterium RIFCSPLOWO2_01_FULL_40_15 TaxID=1798686 RepID=A0A1F6N2H1_9BACT|nr:MAG: asparagine--tRNA ligase [Candidatus Magasanikbacteria bacterium RIFCSPHIGHO2_01_FULL_41_23]OGH66838.1 MAG: asparagine--tRNA ligase [Candidatus Magasanikbacteria bacterium RIFCSPHIGHO2_02_FULL_41_35]OGH74821.1 MAG: asparagine--tRNA ligase [Candidatus Magasanikbacteria bacterium RIFCSPHIGHO2_12_FULL_41_16]OGH78097.1 MAG: asparagine--tRNA ligase [Candidatus Magasanikbacteria bacterium RIFCSPLOWO2_01_FULL_40_15]